jgi:hypothetical protein
VDLFQWTHTIASLYAESTQNHCSDRPADNDKADPLTDLPQSSEAAELGAGAAPTATVPWRQCGAVRDGGWFDKPQPFRPL